MSWKEKTVEQSREEFVLAALCGEDSISELCRKAGISRPTAYKWMRRYQAGEPLSDRSHTTRGHPNRTPPETEALILEARTRHPTWGGRKLIRYLQDKGYQNLPAASTATEILKRGGRISPEESEAHKPYRRFQKEEPNQLWQMDFKGHFAMADGRRCHPLTMSDDCSRKLLCLDAYDNERWKSVERSLLRVFSEYGLPDAILSDNGPPWADHTNGYTPYEIWMMQLGILPMHGRALHPQTQGKEERFHRTLKEDVLKRYTIRDLVEAQSIFDHYREEYNVERPHAALNYVVPEKHYRSSARKLPSTWGEPEYDAGATLRKVNCKGYLSIQKHRYYLSESFAGKYVELLFRSENKVRVCYGAYKIAKINLSEKLFISRKIYPRDL